MSQSRSLLLAIIVLACSGSVCAQRRGERLPAPRDPQFYQPRNKLEEFESRVDSVLIQGLTWTGTLRVTNGTARVEAIQILDTRDPSQASGVLVVMNSGEPAGTPSEIRVFIDYEEVDPLLRAFDTIAKASDSVTKLAHFETRYRTHGDFEIMVFKEVAGGAIAAAVEGGYYDRKRLFMSLEDLTKLRWMIAQAKDRLDELK